MRLFALTSSLVVFNVLYNVKVNVIMKKTSTASDSDSQDSEPSKFEPQWQPEDVDVLNQTTITSTITGMALDRFWLGGNNSRSEQGLTRFMSPGTSF